MIMISIGIPVPVGIIFCGDVIDDQVAGIIMVQTADYIQKCRFSGAGRPQNRHKLVFPETKIHIFQSLMPIFPSP